MGWLNNITHGEALRELLVLRKAILEPKTKKEIQVFLECTLATKNYQHLPDGELVWLTIDLLRGGKKPALDAIEATPLLLKSPMMDYFSPPPTQKTWETLLNRSEADRDFQRIKTNLQPLMDAYTSAWEAKAKSTTPAR